MTTVSTIGNRVLDQILSKTRHAAALGDPGPLSTSEALAAALVLNRPDWLAAMGYTLAESIERIGPDWCQLIPAAAEHFKRDAEAAAYEETEKARQNKLAEFTARKPTDESIWCRSGADRSPRSGPRCVSGWRMRKPSCARSRTCTASPGGKVNRST